MKCQRCKEHKRTVSFTDLASGSEYDLCYPCAVGFYLNLMEDEKDWLCIGEVIVDCITLINKNRQDLDAILDRACDQRVVQKRKKIMEESNGPKAKK